MAVTWKQLAYIDTDHGGLTGLADDDHPQYLLATGARAGASVGAQTFTLGVVDSTLTATRLLASNDSKRLASVANLSAWIAGTANRVTVTDDGDGTLTLSLPQDLHNAAAPTFAGLIAAYLRPAADSTTAVQVRTAGGTAIISVDTTNSRTSITGRLTIEDATTSNKAIYVGANRFLHNFHHPTGGTAVPLGYNTFVGELCGNFTVGSTAAGTHEGSRNTGVGYSSLPSLTTGYSNVAIGATAGYSMTTGSLNVAIGEAALLSVTTGAQNFALGCNALRVATGSNNIAIGYTALYNLGSSSGNIAIGTNAGRAQADGTTALTAATNSIYIGYLVRGKDNSDSNSIVIGNTGIGLGANTTVLGNSSTLLAQVWGAHRLPNVAVPTAAADTIDLYATDLAAGDSGLHIRSETGAIWKFGSKAVVPDGGHIELGATTGTKIGTATSQKLGFFNATPVVQPTALTAANASALNTGDATSDTVIGNMRTRIGEIETKLKALGLLA